MEHGGGRFEVLVADRVALFRKGMIGLLQERRPDWHVAEAGCFDDVLAYLRGTLPAVLVLDLLLAGMEGVAGVHQLRCLCPAAGIVVLADADARSTILDCLAAGAQAYVLKSASPAQFERALDTILEGGVFAPASLTGMASPPPAARGDAGRVPVPRDEGVPVPRGDGVPVPRGDGVQAWPPVLTDRQRDVFRLLAEGCATKTIARRLGLSAGTVKVHLAAIYRAMGAHSRTEAMAKACGGFIVPLPADGSLASPHAPVAAGLGRPTFPHC